jgi:hypothetical protein
MSRPTLAEEVADYAGRGFIIEHHTDTAAQLRKPKSFSALTFLALTCVFVVPGVLYLVAYLGRSDELIYLYVDHSGHVRRRGGKWTLGSWIGRRVSGRA